uniref:Uncharacterized protein n=1 Tax=Opuntia streptacantha TaxID=393608 RepID=A0A7C9AJK3_OPUST
MKHYFHRLVPYTSITIAFFLFFFSTFVFFFHFFFGGGGGGVCTEPYKAKHYSEGNHRLEDKIANMHLVLQTPKCHLEQWDIGIHKHSHIYYQQGHATGKHKG